MRNDSYGRYLAEVYDKLNSDIDYEKWADFLEECFKRYARVPVKHICEMACGTGTMSLVLEKRGYTLTSSDLSDEMLSIADFKMRNDGRRNIIFTNQDMRSFTAASKAQCVICLLDSINCLQSPSDVKACFKSAYDILDDGGVFLFDINSKYKFENIYSDNAYILENDGVLCAWQNFYDDKTKKCDFELSFFLRSDDGLYERHDEEQRERMYTEKSVGRYLSETGFEVCGVFSDFDFKTADENKHERLYFAAVKSAQSEKDGL